MSGQGDCCHEFTMNLASHASSLNLAMQPPHLLRTERPSAVIGYQLWYINYCLPKVFEEWCKLHPQCGTQGLLLHQNNASAHTAAATLHFLVKNSLNLVTYLPYSPYLAPCDWFLFPFIKQQLWGIRFQHPEDAQAFFKGIIFTIPQSTCSGVMHRWFERMTKGIDAGGEFIKRLALSVCQSVSYKGFGYELCEPPSCIPKGSFFGESCQTKHASPFPQ